MDNLAKWSREHFFASLKQLSLFIGYIFAGIVLWAMSSTFGRALLFEGVQYVVAALWTIGFLGLFWWFDEDKPEIDDQDRGARIATPEECTHVLGRGRVQLNGIRLGSVSGDAKVGPDGKLAVPLEFEEHPLSYTGENHLITFGKPGSGKGTRVIVPNLLAVPTSCIVIDPKGQNAAITARARRKLGNRVFILNPYNVLPAHLKKKGNYVTKCARYNPLGRVDPDSVKFVFVSYGKSLADEQVTNRARYNPLDRIDPESVNFVGDVGSLAQSLIIYQGGDTHWPDAARELVGALIMHVCMASDPETRNLGHVRALLNQELEGFALTLADMIQSGFPPLAQKAAQFTEGTDETKSIISAARTQLAFLDDPAICDALAASDFHFADMKREAITVYLVLPFKQIAAQARWLRLLITSAIEELTEEPQPGDKRVLFMLDEFAQLGRLHAVERALALVRGYGVQLWPFLQDLPQLKSTYPDRWESFLATAGVVQFFTPNDNTTAEYVSQRCGVQLVKRKSVSESKSKLPNGAAATATPSGSTSTSTADHWEPLFRPWDLYGGKLRSYQQLLFVEGLSPVVISWAQAPYHRDALGPKNYQPDPFHLPAPKAPAKAPAPAPEQVDGAQASA